jgi:hypothetical protein
MIFGSITVEHEDINASQTMIIDAKDINEKITVKFGENMRKKSWKPQTPYFSI